MNFLDELEFNAKFGYRLKAVREAMGWSQEKMAASLGVKTDAYKKYENREKSGFPLYLMPRLILFTDKPYSFWVSGLEEAPSKHRFLKSA